MKTSLFIATLLFLTSCASQQKSVDSYYEVFVDAAKSEDIKHVRFHLQSGMAGVDSSDVFFKEYASIAINALEAAGFRHVPKSKADLIIKLSYSIGDSRTISESRNQTVYGTKGWGHPVEAQGYKTVVDSYTLYTRRAKIDAYSKQNKKMLWSVQMRSEGYSNNLKRAFPYLIAAGEDYFNSSIQSQQVQVGENSPHVQKLLVRKPASAP